MSSYKDVRGSDRPYFDALARFFETQYFALLQKARCNIVYLLEEPWPTWDDLVDNDEHEQRETEPEINTQREATRRDIAKSVDMSGFDSISAISRAAINAYFRQMWQIAKRMVKNNSPNILARWEDEKLVATFEKIVVHLLSKNRAILWIRLYELQLPGLTEASRMAYVYACTAWSNFSSFDTGSPASINSTICSSLSKLRCNVAKQTSSSVYLMDGALSVWLQTFTRRTTQPRDMFRSTSTST